MNLTQESIGRFQIQTVSYQLFSCLNISQDFGGTIRPGKDELCSRGSLSLSFLGTFGFAHLCCNRFGRLLCTPITAISLLNGSSGAHPSQPNDVGWGVVLFIPTSLLPGITLTPWPVLPNTFAN